MGTEDLLRGTEDLLRGTEDLLRGTEDLFFPGSSMYCPDSHIIYLTCLQSMYFRLNCMIFYSFAIIYKKGYQDFDNVQSVVTTKVKGIAMVNTTVHPNIQPIWDVADYIVPPQVSDCLLQPEVSIIITHQGAVVNCTSLPQGLSPRWVRTIWYHTVRTQSGLSPCALYYPLYKICSLEIRLADSHDINLL